MSMDEQIRLDIINYRRQKAHQLMCDVKVLMEHEMWNSSKRPKMTYCQKFQ